MRAWCYHDIVIKRNRYRIDTLGRTFPSGADVSLCSSLTCKTSGKAPNYFSEHWARHMAFWLTLFPLPTLQNCSDTAGVSVAMPVTQVTLQLVSRLLFVYIQMSWWTQQRHLCLKILTKENRGKETWNIAFLSWGHSIQSLLKYLWSSSPKQTTGDTLYEHSLALRGRSKALINGSACDNLSFKV